jgi:hypothetical protein
VTSPIQSLINHVAFVLDGSTSMKKHTSQVIKVVDAEIKYLATLSESLEQETRVTIYSFGDEVTCLVYDKDVLRLPTVRELYRADGNTALIAATIKSQDDLALTAQLYGDHAFLTYVVTDGQENVSEFSSLFGGKPQYENGRFTHNARRGRFTTSQLTRQLSDKLATQPENWTVACLVPNSLASLDAKRFGFPSANIAVWDTESRDGFEVAMTSTVRRATESFMVSRSQGVRGSKTLFVTTDQVNRGTVKQATAAKALKVADKSTYDLLTVPKDGSALSYSGGSSNPDHVIKEFVEAMTDETYRPGSAYYELSKPEKIQPQKLLAVRNRKSGRIYVGPAARGILGLPDHEVRVKPDTLPDYQIFVQSTSVNRKLVPDSKVIVFRVVQSNTASV